MGAYKKGYQNKRTRIYDFSLIKYGQTKHNNNKKNLNQPKTL